MKITFRWSNSRGEGSPSKADVDRLFSLAREAGGFDVAVADFLQDVAADAKRLYEELMALPRDREQFLRHLEDRRAEK